MGKKVLAVAAKAPTKTEGMVTLGDLAKIEPVVPRGVQQIRDHKLKEDLYFKFPVAIAILSVFLDEAIKALENIGLDAAWWYGGRGRAYFAPLYPENTEVSNFGDQEKENFRQKLAQIAACLIPVVKGAEDNPASVEVLPSIPMVFSETQQEYEITREFGLDVGYALNYRILRLSCDGLNMRASFSWRNRRRGDSKKGEAMFMDGDKVAPILIDLTPCRTNSEIAEAVVVRIFGNDTEAFRKIKEVEIMGWVSRLFADARSSRRRLEEAEANNLHVRQLHDADLDW